MSSVTPWISISFFIILFASCQKELKYDTANDLLSDRVWFLEKLTTTSAAYYYRGSSTFSFQLTNSSKSYRDSDGIIGKYEIVESPQGIWMHISSPGLVIESYKISQLERNHFVAEVFFNNDWRVFFFSSRP